VNIYGAGSCRRCHFIPKNAIPMQLERKTLMKNGGFAGDERKLTIWPDRGTQQARPGSPTPKVIASVRVSTNEQSKKGVSLSAQEQGIRLYCKGNGWQCVEVIREDGYNPSALRGSP